MSDVETEITNSLDRAGRGAMTGQLKSADGSAVAPGITFGSQLSSGFFYNASSDWHVVTGGSVIAKFQDNVLIADGSAAAPGLAFVGDDDSGFYLNAAGDLHMTIAGAKVLEFGANKVEFEGTAPKFRMEDTDNTADAKVFEWRLAGGTLTLVALEDDLSTVVSTLFSFGHDGTTSIPGISAGLTNNLVATTAPGVNDDITTYTVGSMWIDVTNDRWYMCVDSTNAAAVWIEVPKKTEAHTWTSLQTFTSGITSNGTTSLTSDVVLTGNVSVTDHTDTSSGGSITFDFDEGNILECTLTENITTPTLSNLNANGIYEIWITQHASAAKTVAGWSGVTWVGGSPPTMNTTLSSVMVLQLRKNGTIILGTALNAG
jgi:hypothetical protein